MKLIVLIVLSMLVLSACSQSEKSIVNGKIEMEFNEWMHSRLSNHYSEDRLVINEFQPADYLIIGEEKIQNFKVTKVLEEDGSDEGGNYHIVIINGIAIKNGISIEKIAQYKSYKAFPDFIVADIQYKNTGKQSIEIAGWVNHHYSIQSDDTSKAAFWSYQSGSYESRADWVLPLPLGFEQENYMGMNDSDYGGGTPVVDIWRKDGGLAVGHLEMVPKLVSLPISRDQNSGLATMAITYDEAISLKPAETISTFTTFVAVHQGDYFQSLRQYSNIMQKRGIEFKEPPKEAYEPIWCAWGYERGFNTKEVLNTLPKVKEMGYKWAVLDDGWQTAEGDWYLRKDKFPRGDRDMKAFVDKIHSYDMKAKLWWAPLAVDPGTDLVKKDLTLINKDGKYQDITWWDSYYLCPAYDKTIDYTRELVIKIIKEWDYDGLKIDGQHLNGVPPCYNPAHNHAYPEESVEKLADFYKMIYETARSIKPYAVIEICPCGTAYAFHNLPYMNQTVSSDPLSSWQIRLKGKTLHALMGDKSAYYGDHVELSDNGNDFASSVGIGAIIGTKFTWPTDKHPQKGYVLSPGKEKEWKKWLDIYNKYMLPQGEYLGELYDIGFDKPETHVIRKNDKLFFGLYAKEYDGLFEIRGLENESGSYEVMDIVSNKMLGTVQGSNPYIKLNFDDFLLFVVY